VHRTEKYSESELWNVMNYYPHGKLGFNRRNINCHKLLRFLDIKKELVNEPSTRLIA